MVARVRFYIRRAYLRLFKHCDLLEFEMEEKEVKELLECGFLRQVGKHEYEFTDLANKYFQELLDRHKNIGV